MKDKLIKFVRAYPGIPWFLIAYYIAIILIKPIPNVPICDTWAYAKITKRFLETGSIQFLGFGAMNLVLHILWGALFCIFSGFSFVTLNVSTLALSFIASIAFYLIIKRLNFSEPQASLASLLLIVNPIFFINSFSFMTDIPFMCWMLLAILFYLKSLNEKGNLFLFLGSLFSIFAFLVRQNGILTSLAACIFYFISNEQRRRLSPLRLLILIAIPIVAMLAFSYWQHFKANVERWHLFLRSFQDIIFILEYMGLFCLPLILSYMARLKNYYYNVCKNNLQILLISSVIIVANTVIIAANSSKLMPYFPAWITEYGVFTDQIIVGDREIITSPSVWVVITMLTVFSSVTLLIFILLRLRALFDLFMYNGFFRRKLKKVFLPLGIFSMFISIFLILGRRWLFQKYEAFYNYLYIIGYVKRTLRENFYKIVIIHNNLIVWSTILAILSFIYLRKAKLFHKRQKSQLVGLLMSKIREISLSPHIFIYIVTLFQLIVLLLMKDLSDRYLIILIPGTVIFVLDCAKNLKFSRAVFIIIIFVFFTYSVIITSDTNAWNKAAWEGGEYLIGQGISSKQIDAGLAWNGWYFDKPIIYSIPKPRSWNPKTWYLLGMFAEIDNEYTVASSEIEGYKTIKTIGYHSLLTFLTNKRKFIYVLRRIQN